MNSGIYQIRNKIDNNIYVGQSRHLRQRKNDHFHHLRWNKHGNIHLQRAYNKYGCDNFVFETLIYCDEEMLTYYEQSVVNKLNPKYNLLKECVDSPIGYKHSEATRKKLSEIQSKRDNNKIFTSEVREKIRRSKIGRTVSQETRQKIRDFNLGRTFIMKDDHKEKIRKSLTGKPKSKTHRDNLSKARVGKKVSDEARKNIIRGLKGNSYRAKNHRGFISPDGIIYKEIFNLAAFAREQNIVVTRFWELLSGKKKQYRGWKLYAPTGD